jgi:hypothetical protein
VAYTIGFAAVEPWGPGLATLLLGLAVTGLVGGRWRAWGGGTLALLCLVVPVFLAYLIATQREFVFPRFVLFSSLALYLLAASGIGFAWRRSAIVGAALSSAVLVSAVPGLAYHYDTERTAYASSDYLIVLDRLATHAHPDDIILLDQAWAAGYARAYLPQPQPAIRWLEPSWAAHGERASAEVEQLLQRHQRVWLFTSPGEKQWQPSVVESALLRHSGSAFVDHFGEFRLRLFVKPEARGSCRRKAK